MPKFDHAVVLGGSVAGLLAATALSESFAQVTIVDRDELHTDGADALFGRRGVPQGDQVHHMLELGSGYMEQLLPGLRNELVDDYGCQLFSDTADFNRFVGGTWKMRVPSHLQIMAFERRVFELAIRRRTLGLPNVTSVKGMATGLVASEDRRRVIGVKARGVEGGEIRADFVVDATGRGSRAPAWMEDLGYDAPEEKHLRVYMGYTTFTARLEDGSLPKDLQGVSISGPGGLAGVLRPCGNGLHYVVCAGVLKNYPPEDLDSMMKVFEGLDSPIVFDAVKRATVASEATHYKMPGDQRRLWEDLDRRPEGFAVVGDAVASFNPAYGQGMTMGALGATVLRDTFAAADTLEGAADAVQQALRPWVDLAFNLAIGVDSRFPGAEFENMEPPSALDRARDRATEAAMTEEAHVLIASRSMMMYMDASYMQDPAVQQTIDEWVRDDRQPHPRMKDPLNPPGVSEPANASA
jgi:2-polyprenyl-6-methoxyphenol hydroxylase-like FAD-dependent oxidoreductase